MNWTLSECTFSRYVGMLIIKRKKWIWLPNLLKIAKITVKRGPTGTSIQAQCTPPLLSQACSSYWCCVPFLTTALQVFVRPAWMVMLTQRERRKVGTITRRSNILIKEILQCNLKKKTHTSEINHASANLHANKLWFHLGGGGGAGEAFPSLSPSQLINFPPPPPPPTNNFPPPPPPPPQKYWFLSMSYEIVYP